MRGRRGVSRRLLSGWGELAEFDTTGIIHQKQTDCCAAGGGSALDIAMGKLEVIVPSIAAGMKYGNNFA